MLGHANDPIDNCHKEEICVLYDVTKVIKYSTCCRSPGNLSVENTAENAEQSQNQNH